MNQPEERPEDVQSSRPLGTAGWVALIILAGFLAGAIYYAAHVWNSLPGVPIPTIGWVFMGLGALFTLLVGGGLMALLFYSSRKGKDF